MYFSDLSKEDCLKTFEEIFRFPAFYSESSNGWLRRIFGKCGEFFVIDQTYLFEDPSTTSLTDAENVKKHWFIDASHNYTTYLTDAYKREIIDEETYRRYMSADVFCFCENDGAPKTPFTVKCPYCAETFRLLLPDPFIPTGGVIPSCPFCGGFMLSVRAPFGKKTEHGEIFIDHLEAGASYSSSMFCFYPDVEGESDADREERLVGITLKACENVVMDGEEKKSLITELYRNNPYILHAVPDLLRAISEAEGEEKERRLAAFRAIKAKDEANSSLSALGYVTKRSAGLPPVQSVPVTGNPGLGLAASFSAPLTAKHRFCPNCGTPVRGKFCEECGTKVN